MGGKIKKIYELPEYAKKLMSYIYNVIGTENFILYGGAPIDLMRDKNCEISDYDLAISGKTQEKIKRVANSLMCNGFEIIEPCRKYHIYHDMEVILMYARNNKIMLDICFMDDVEMVGQFNLESLYWKYPEMECIDNYDAIKSIEDKKIIPIRGLEKENVFLLVSRFLYLCSKYNINLLSDRGDYIIDLLHKKLSEYSHSESEQYISCLSSIFKSILRARNRRVFIKELVDSGLIRIIYPLLHVSLNNVLQNEHNSEVIGKIINKKKLLYFLEGHLEKKDRVVFRNRIKMLSKRKWNNQDKALEFYV